MAKVSFADHLLQYTNGVKELDLTVDSYRELLAILDNRFPGCVSQIDKCAVAIDSQIYQDAFSQSIGPDSEVFFMQRIAGG